MAIFSISLRLLIPLKGVLKKSAVDAHFSGHVIFLQRLVILFLLMKEISNPA